MDNALFFNLSKRKLKSATLASLKWHLQAELPRLHATTPLWHKNIDSYGVQTGPVDILDRYS